MNPQYWQHKKTKKKFRVMPWWECLDDQTLLSEKDLPPDMTDGRKYKIGALIQVGWLLENEHGVWLGVGPDAAKEFKVVKPRKKK